jgi:DHA1 family inner membrane transport protein
VPIREVRLSAGAEFIVVICGEIMTMPGLPKVPSAEVIGLDAKGQIDGSVLFGLFPYIAVLLEQRGAGGLREAGFVLAGFALGGFVYIALIRLLLSRLGLYGVIRAGAAVAGLGFAALAFSVSWPVEMAIVFVIGLGFYMIHNALQTQATELAPTKRASAVAAHAFFFFLGQAIGPLIYRLGFDTAGVEATFISGGIVMVLTGIATAAGLKARTPALT